MEEHCFVCKRGEGSVPFIKCNSARCTKVYHKGCLKQFKFLDEPGGMNWYINS